MLCHQHPADPALAACQRCQRGLCRGCTKQFVQQVCTHCIEQSVSTRVREARRTLWLSLPVFTLAAWAAAMALPGLPSRVRLYVAGLVGMSALGAFVGQKRWRRAPGLASGTASMPESETPLWERFVAPLLAGIAFWPWLLVETLRDMQLAKQLRAYVPADERTSTFGFGEASLALASVAAAFTLGTHALSQFTPLAGKLWATEASLASRTRDAVRTQLAAPTDAPATPREAAPVEVAPVGAAPMGAAPVGAAAHHAALQRVAPPEAAPDRAAPTATAPGTAPPHGLAPDEVAPESASASAEPLPSPAAAAPPQGVAPPEESPTEPREESARGGDEARKRAHHSRHEVEAAPSQPAAAPAVAQAAPEATVVRDEPTAPPAVVPAAAAPPLVIDRRFVPGSEMARQAQAGNRRPDGTYVTASGRVVMPAPPPH